LECVRKRAESEFIGAVLFCGYIQDFNPVSPYSGDTAVGITQLATAVLFISQEFNSIKQLGALWSRK
jgi:hypothetical protein